METLGNLASIREPCEHISSMQIAPSYLYIFIMYPNWQFTLKYGIFLKNLDSTAFEAKMSYTRENDIRMIQHFLPRPNVC